MSLKKIILLILIICWMVTIFIFSNQVSDVSSNTSKKSIRAVIDRLPSTKNLTETQKKEIVEKAQTPVRKLAHFSIYTLGGVLMMAFFCNFDMKNKKRIILSLIGCALYAVLDEAHQYFVSR